MSAARNTLSSASSAYLQSAAHQPVHWHAWGDEAFRRAEMEGKPILLDIGAVWCHWCHVMDRESYESGSTAALINELYIAVKVDRDERPDVDSRYQAAVGAISGQGGWPLTAFLTPDGRPYFGGTYFPPEERSGRPSFERVLRTMSDAFRERPDEVEDSAESIMQAIEHNESFSGAATDLQSSGAGTALLGKLINGTLNQYDPRNGGFGSQPKFPHPGAIDMLLDASCRPGAQAEKAADAALTTLHKMGRGGIFDQLAGGFHRYSVDERWIVPHFEKMAYDNAALLRTYARASQSFHDPECAAKAEAILRWMDEWLSDRDKGGFYSSQDADLSLEDDGNYFTWTQEEAALVLSAEEFSVAGPYFDIGPVGDMHHDPKRNVLHTPLSIEETASRSGYSIREAQSLLAPATRKLYAARQQRPAPFVDRTLYTGWNALCISAYFVAAQALERPAATDFALKSLDRMLAGVLQEGSVAHVLAYGDGEMPPQPVPGVLEDYAFLGHACLDAWERRGSSRYYEAASTIAASMIERFYDVANAGFFDTEQTGGKLLGALSARRKPIQDAPTPAGNSVAASLLLRLAALNGRADYERKARETLELSASIVEHFGLYAASFGLALGQLVRPPIQVVILGEDAVAAELESAALSTFATNKSVVRIRRDQIDGLPPALRETLPHLRQAGTLALVCAGMSCQPPISDVEHLRNALASIQGSSSIN